MQKVHLSGEVVCRMEVCRTGVAPTAVIEVLPVAMKVVQLVVQIPQVS